MIQSAQGTRGISRNLRIVVSQCQSQRWLNQCCIGREVYQGISGAASDIDSPIAKQKVVDLARAKHLIGMLAMLRQKSHGNLEPMEADYLDAVIEDLVETYRVAAPDEPDEPDEPDDP